MCHAPTIVFNFFFFFLALAFKMFFIWHSIHLWITEAHQAVMSKLTHSRPWQTVLKKKNIAILPNIMNSSSQKPTFRRPLSHTQGFKKRRHMFTSMPTLLLDRFQDQSFAPGFLLAFTKLRMRHISSNKGLRCYTPQT